MDETKMTAFHGSPRVTIDVGVFQFLAKKWIGKTAHNADPIKAIKVAHKGDWHKVADEFEDLETLVVTVGKDK